MNTKITNKVLERYALSYVDIMRCVKVKSMRFLVSPIMSATIFKNEIEYIQLRSIDSITDEEKMNLADILNLALVENFIESIKHNDKYLCSAVNALSAFQYLQSIGIATPTINEKGEIITVEEMVEEGKLRLV